MDHDSLDRPALTKQDIEVTTEMVEAAIQVFGEYEVYDPEWTGFNFEELREIMPQALARSFGAYQARGKI